MPRGKKDKQEVEAVEELKDAAEEASAVPAAAATEEPLTVSTEAEAAVAPEPTEQESEAKHEVGEKRKAEEPPEDAPDDEETKRNKAIDAALIAEALAGDANDASTNAELVPAAREGQAFFTDNDVLSGRGGGKH